MCVSARELSRPEARALPQYNAGATEDAVRAKFGLTQVTKLASNESGLGASNAVGDALKASIGQVHRYPDPNCTLLRGEIGKLVGIDPARVIVGNGSEDIIEMLCKAFLSPGDRLLTLAPSFGLHEIFPAMMGATVEKIPVTAEREFDVPAWCAALSRPTKMVMFSTPSNPVGCVLNGPQLQAICEASPRETVLVVDEAYYEYACGPQFADSVAILAAQPRPWIVLRTLSKAYGLAGLRVGYGLASDPDLVALLDRVRTPFNVNHFAQVGAIAAIRDTVHLNTVVSATRHERQVLRTRLAELDRVHAWGLRQSASHGNFLFVDTGRNARVIALDLMTRGIIVKPWAEAGYESFIRVTVGPREANDRFLRALTEVLSPATGVRRTGI